MHHKQPFHNVYHGSTVYTYLLYCRCNYGKLTCVKCDPNVCRYRNFREKDEVTSHDFKVDEIGFEEFLVVLSHFRPPKVDKLTQSYTLTIYPKLFAYVVSVQLWHENGQGWKEEPNVCLLCTSQHSVFNKMYLLYVHTAQSS